MKLKAVPVVLGWPNPNEVPVRPVPKPNAGFAAVLPPKRPVPGVVVPSPVVPKPVVPKPVVPKAGVVPVAPKDSVVLGAVPKRPVPVLGVEEKPPNPAPGVPKGEGVVVPKLKAGCFVPNNEVPVLAVLPKEKALGAEVVAAPNAGFTPKELG